MSRWRIIPPFLGSIEAKGLSASVDEPVKRTQRVVVKLESSEVEESFVSIATNVWKARSRLSRAAGSPSNDLERVERHLDAIVDCLGRLGFEIKDHTGEPFDYGQALKVAGSQRKAGISHEFVAETIRPTIYLKGVMLQQGEVVIDVPDSTSEG